MTSSELRNLYLRFFEEKGHLIAPSDSLTPDDPTLLFTSAGMVQFKPFFTGERVPPKTRMTTSQKCLRTGDLDIVGTTAIHHTFFEMLGNFSFGDYFKDEAIAWAWEFLTGRLKLQPDRLWVTVYQNDDEAAEIWENKIGIPAQRIVRLGEKSNYWPSNAPSEGPNGPCGPCSEIFYDFGEDIGCKTPQCGPDCDCGRFSEIWNLVFMQFNREEGGTLTPLPRKNIDTGMGLERMISVIQGTPTNFETDLFMPIVAKAASLTGVEYGKDKNTDVALRVISDHIRAMVFAISDGVMPSNVGRGYVLRRIIRRAVLKGKSLGLSAAGGFLDQLAPVVIGIMEGPYPEVRERQDHISRTIRTEEEKFRRTLDIGLQKLEESIAGMTATEIPGMEAFVLYDTYGFPLELTQEIAAERGLTVDLGGFEEAMEEQRRKAREGSDISTDLFAGSLGALAEIEKAQPATEFVGYEAFASTSKVVGLLKDGELVNSALTGEKIDVVLDITPFYPESGGQVADTGAITRDGTEVQVECTARVGSLIVHSGEVRKGELKVGDQVTAAVDTESRLSTMRNHTATHLLHRALRMMLGEHVVQSGSLVEPARLRFDFTHNQQVTAGELDRIERIVIEEILKDDEVNVTEKTLEQAKADGAMALFTEKYSGTVRVVKVGDYSMELCGGTHAHRTSQIGSFKIVSEGSIGAGLRRIEAVTGMGAFEYARANDRLLGQTAEALKVNPADIPEAVSRLAETVRALEKQIESLKRKTAVGQVDELASKAVEHNGVRLVASRVEADVETMSSLADTLAGKLKSAVILLAAPSDGKVIFVGKVTADLVQRGFHAGNLVREVAKIAGGGGGGRPDFAQAGGRDIGKLDEALAKAGELIEQQAGK